MLLCIYSCASVLRKSLNCSNIVSKLVHNFKTKRNSQAFQQSVQIFTKKKNFEVQHCIILLNRKRESTKHNHLRDTH